MTLELVVIAGDDIGREVIPLAVKSLRGVVPNLRTIDAEAGWDHAWRTGQAVTPLTLELIRERGSALMGPERPFVDGQPSALQEISDALDLCAALYPIRNPALGVDLLLLVENQPDIPISDTSERRAFSPMDAWSATRLGNLAGMVAARRRGKIVLAHDSEESFVSAVTAGIEEHTRVERIDALLLVNHFLRITRGFDVIVTSHRTSRLLVSHIVEHIGTLETGGRLLLGPQAAVATPVHGPLRDQVGWGFANPLGAIRSTIVLLRYWWNDERTASHLEQAVERAILRRRTPDMGGVHTMHEMTRAILQEVATSSST